MNLTYLPKKKKEKKRGFIEISYPRPREVNVINRKVGGAVYLSKTSREVGVNYP